ncbi:MAG: porin [Candidatus Didemnitutus sp.]|nr:porin [Candidatus Didemnitutus sp.]
MLKLTFRFLAMATALFAAGFASAQDSGPLIDLLIRKGVLNDQEAEELRAELSRDAAAAVVSTVSAGKSTNSIALSGRLQVQYAGVGSDQNLPDANQIFLRRVYFGMSAGLGAAWSVNFNYDFSGGNFDKAYAEWSGYFGAEPVAFDFGLRKVNFGYEEYTSSGSLKAIERSPVTRFFVEPNNGRRLGAASYRMGLFLEGGEANVRKNRSTGLFYGAALTTVNRTETFGDASVDGAKSSSSGNGALNQMAVWTNVGYSRVVSPSTKFMVGAAYGFLPDVGGAGNSNFGRGHDISEFSLYGDLTVGRFNLAAEYLAAEVDGVLAAGTVAAKPSGYWVQPSFMVTEKLEAVVRYSEVDADGRGIRASDGIRSAPALRTGQRLEESYFGLNYYFLGSDVKLQLGYLTGRTSEGATEKVDGLRSQLQLNF